MLCGELKYAANNIHGTHLFLCVCVCVCVCVWTLPNDEVTSHGTHPDLQETVTSECSEQVEPSLQE